MICPNDSTALRKATYKGSEISVCIDCKGVWLDYGVLTEILRVAEPDWAPEQERRILQRLTMYNIAPLGEDRDLSCPHCGIELDEVNYQGTSNIIVNPCSAGHGLWLDHGELLTIRIFLNHWYEYAQNHRGEIGEILANVDRRIGAIRGRVIGQAPGSNHRINQMIYEALEMLDGN